METRDHQNTNIYSLNTNFAKSLIIKVYNGNVKTLNKYSKTTLYTNSKFFTIEILFNL